MRMATHAVAIGSYAQACGAHGNAVADDFDPHKPYIDAYAFACDHEGYNGTMKRVPEVVDTWFDSDRCRSRSGTIRSRIGPW